MPTDDPDPRLDEVFGPDAVRWRTLDELMTGHHLASPHHYLFAIGVLPDYQGNGLGDLERYDSRWIFDSEDSVFDIWVGIQARTE